MRVRLPVVCSHRIKNSYRGLVVGPHLPRCMRKPATRTKCTERHQPTVTAVNYARHYAEMLQGSVFFLFLSFSYGLRVVSLCLKKKTARKYENDKATVFLGNKKRILSSANHVCASCTPPPPSAYPMFLHISTTSVPSKPCLA